MTNAQALLNLTSKLVGAYVAHNPVPVTELETLLRAVHRVLSSLAAGESEHHPAVEIRASITYEYIVCLEDGKRLKMLKRYLRSHYGLTPEEYRAKWKLPLDYPMTAPNYAAQRSYLAKQFGLGRTAKDIPARTKRAR